MKKIVSGVALQEKMCEAIDLLCDTVKVTLGPKGNNVIIDHSNFSPFITNDGVTIAQNIENEDEVLSAIIEIAKESSIKTNEVVGDGTTTTLVLLQALFKGSVAAIKRGTNSILLKKDLQICLEKIIEDLRKMAIKPTEEMLTNIAKVSSNEEELGEVVSAVFKKVHTKAAITIEEISQSTLEVSFMEGYTFPIQLSSPYFLQDKKQVTFSNACLLIVNDTLHDTEEISVILNEVLDTNKSLVIVANDYDDYFVNEIVSLYLNKQINCILLRIDEYGSKQRCVQKDLEVLSNARILENSSKLTSAHFGKVNHLVVTMDTARIDFKFDKKIESYISQLRQEQEVCKDDFMQEYYQKRVAMFTTGVAKIILGASTKTECRERRMRLEDAICAVSVSQSGVLPGGGVSLLQVSSLLDTKSEAEQIWKSALVNPFDQILFNAGVDSKNILKEIEKKHYKVLYNAAEC